MINSLSPLSTHCSDKTEMAKLFIWTNLSMSKNWTNENFDYHDQTKIVKILIWKIFPVKQTLRIYYDTTYHWNNNTEEEGKDVDNPQDLKNH